MAWPTHIQSRTPDGQFGPSMQIRDWSDCWFIAALGAVANDQEGHKILAESIQKVNGGYDVTFRASPHTIVFISDAALQKSLEIDGGDADTRLIELAAGKLFCESGKAKSMLIAALMKGGWDQEDAEQCVQTTCTNLGVRDPMAYNPMISGAPVSMAFFMFTGRYPDGNFTESGTTPKRSHVMRFLRQYGTHDRGGPAIAICGIANPLGSALDSHRLVIRWDAIRTEMTANGILDEQQRAFLNALDKWLETGDSNDMQALRSAAGVLRLQHIDLVAFVDMLDRNQLNMNQDQFNLLRSGVREVLSGGPGYIGFTGDHSGTIEGINMARNIYTYSEPNHPTLVHTGELSGLIQEILSGTADLLALEPTTGQDEAESSHAGSKRARHLQEIHQQAVRDGTIDPAESGPLANLMEMDVGAFRQVYDSDTNGMIEGGELKAVQLRVDRWVDHLKSTPLW